MRLWTLHPRYLDARGLVAVWREALLAQAVLRGHTRGYTRHPQLDRFRAAPAPVAAIACYLREIHREGLRRGYSFDRGKIARGRAVSLIPATHGQIAQEMSHLLAKLEARDPDRRAALVSLRRILPHPLFHVVSGDVESWEKSAEATGGHRTGRSGSPQKVRHTTGRRAPARDDERATR